MGLLKLECLRPCSFMTTHFRSCKYYDENMSDSIVDEFVHGTVKYPLYCHVFV